MRKLNKLELAWIGKEYYPKLEQRILVEDTAKSHHASFRIIENDIFENQLIFGDNLILSRCWSRNSRGRLEAKVFCRMARRNLAHHIAGVSKTMPKKMNTKAESYDKDQT
jgi:hypothetical protein